MDGVLSRDVVHIGAGNASGASLAALGMIVDPSSRELTLNRIFDFYNVTQGIFGLGYSVSLLRVKRCRDLMLTVCNSTSTTGWASTGRRSAMLKPLST